MFVTAPVVRSTPRIVVGEAGVLGGYCHNDAVDGHWPAPGGATKVMSVLPGGSRPFVVTSAGALV